MTLTDIQKKTFLKIARSAVESRALGRRTADIDTKTVCDISGCGAFVSLHKNNGGLRGCIGTFTSDKPLYLTVEEMAVSASSRDPRFVPVAPHELKQVNIEISVLSPLREVKDVSEIVVGRHGIYIVKGRSRGVLLPQVATEYGFDRDTFLDETCVKAGLSRGSWRENATIMIFEAEIFKEG